MNFWTEYGFGNFDTCGIMINHYVIEELIVPTLFEHCPILLHDWLH